MTKYMNTPLVNLKSVGSLLDIEDKVVYPSDRLGYPDLEMGTPLVEVTDEWAFSLSESDKTLLEDLNLLERW
jgi:hypothetical protein|tara:strand:+ start:317 stop:532 length:216 start_codon:yes stop_codon:yes gene_type:complete